MKLYVAEIRFVMVVCAENAEEAADAVRDYAAEECLNAMDHDGIYEITEVHSSADVPMEWLSALPWGGGADDERTVLQIIKDS